MPSSPFGHPHTQGACYATWYAEKKARVLVGHFGFTASDQEDIQQLLLLALLERWPKFNSAEISPQEFISWAIGRTVAELIRQQQRRQAAEPTQYQPIDELLNDEEASLPAACIEADPTPAIDLALDIEVVLSRLPPAVQETARELRTGNISEVARRLGLSRRTIRDRVRQLREAFVRAGYGDA